MTIKTLAIFGTRPEAIKMAPVIRQLETNCKIESKLCITGQHQQMLNSVLSLFDIRPDFNLQVMTSNQSLSSLTGKILLGLENIFKTFQPNLILVHGDTTTTFAASLSAYYHRIPVAHVEAGLRTGNLNSPWPEEANRKLTTVLTEMHFAPTASARANLLKEGIVEEKIYVTGNTVIDALFEMSNKIDNELVLKTRLAQHFSFLSKERRIILVTGHRRENFGEAFKNICLAIKKIAALHPEVDIVYPLHLNPNVHRPANAILNNVPNIHLMEPIDYLPFVYLMKKAYLILTDSGGIQEEAPSLGKPVLVMRETTERPEALKSGTVKLVGSDTDNIVKNVERLLVNEEAYYRMSQAKNPYGDGLASKRIVDIISRTVLTPAGSDGYEEDLSVQTKNILRKEFELC